MMEGDAHPLACRFLLVRKAQPIEAAADEAKGRESMRVVHTDPSVWGRRTRLSRAHRLETGRKESASSVPPKPHAVRRSAACQAKVHRPLVIGFQGEPVLSLMLCV